MDQPVKSLQVPALQAQGGLRTPPQQYRPIGSEETLIHHDELTSASDAVLFELFAAALEGPGINHAVRQQLLAQFMGADEKVNWHDLEGLDPVQILARAVACAVPDSGQAI